MGREDACICHRHPRWKRRFKGHEGSTVSAAQAMSHAPSLGDWAPGAEQHVHSVYLCRPHSPGCRYLSTLMLTPDDWMVQTNPCTPTTNTSVPPQAPEGFTHSRCRQHGDPEVSVDPTQQCHNIRWKVREVFSVELLMRPCAKGVRCRDGLPIRQLIFVTRFHVRSTPPRECQRSKQHAVSWFIVATGGRRGEFRSCRVWGGIRFQRATA
eukprot:66001-Chlamydomonas_euryale.AAC.2